MKLRAAWVPAALVLMVGCGGVPGDPGEPTGTSQSAATVCGQTTVHGMDVSHYDGMVDWPTAKASGIDFAFAKATESTDFIDPMFATNWAGMKTAGVVRGAYHFFHADVDPVMQANYVMQTVGTLEPDDLPIVLDLETTNGQTQATIVSNAATFLATVTAATGRTAIVYTSPAFLSDFSMLAPYTLWVANWVMTCPDVPAAWTTWGFWQNSSTGTVPGVSGASAVDLDFFNGTLGQLQAMDAGPMPGSDAAVADSGNGGDAGGGGDDAAPQGNDSGPDDAALLGSDAGTGTGSGGGRGPSGSPSPTGATPNGVGSSGCACTSANRGAPPASAIGTALVAMALAASRRRKRPGPRQGTSL